MLKLVYCIRKSPSLSSEEFHRYWLNEHAALMRREAERIGAFRYVQSHRIESPIGDRGNEVRGSEVRPYDGVTELWWQDEAALVPSGFTTEELIATQKKLIADEHKFIDMAASVLFVSREHEIYALQKG